MKERQNMEQLSIIVPVYNNIQYLPHCIDTIINQNYRELEIILVDDGSTDGSGEICDEYQKADPRIQVIHKKNEGCMKARWYGLKKSKGKYVGFVDSDDWLDSYMYKVLMTAAQEKDCDIVSMGYTLVADGQKETRTDDATLFGYYEKGKNLDIFLDNMMYDEREKVRGAQPSLCTKIIRRELLMKAFAGAEENITMGEDAAIFYPCCLESKNIYVMKEYKYFYRVHNASMCRSMNIDIFSEIHLFFQYMQKCFMKYGTKYGLSEQLEKYVWALLEQGVNQVFHIEIKRVYIFPYAAIERGSDIILYGSGAVGRSYYDQIMENRYCNIVTWVDKNNSDGRTILHPGQIPRMSDTKILIAIKKKETADEIMDELSLMDINKERFVWSCPQEIPIV